jgi:hypothetical protein
MLPSTFLTDDLGVVVGPEGVRQYENNDQQKFIDFRFNNCRHKYVTS